MPLIQIYYANNVWFNIKSKHIVFIVSKYTLTQAMMESNGFYVTNVEDGSIANVQIMIHTLILSLNV